MEDIRKTRVMITGHCWSSLESMLVNKWYKYVNLNKSEHSHTVEVVCATVPQILNKDRRWKKTKWRKIEKDFCEVTSACEDDEQLTTNK